MFGRIIAFLLLVGLVAVVGTTIYNAGVTAGIAAEVGDAIASGAPVPIGVYPGPYVGHPWGWGWGGGFLGILTNALRHTPSGGRVDLAARLADNQVVVALRDTGSGMSPEDLGRVFDRFYRSPDSPGTGLGLPIARDLVEAHGGEMTASSEVGLGTTVRFTLPIVSPTAPG